MNKGPKLVSQSLGEEKENNVKASGIISAVRRRWGANFGLGTHIRATHNFRRLAYAASVLLFLLVLGIVAPLYVIPEDTEATSKPANPSSLTYTSSSSTASANLTVTDINGTFAASTDGTNGTEDQRAAFTIETDNATGYILNVKLSNNTTTLAKDASNALAMLSEAKTVADSSDSTNVFTNNSWGVLPSKHSGNNNTATYYPLTTTGFKMDETSTGNKDNANSYTIGLGLKADYSKSAGTYTNSVVQLEYVAKAVTYAIYYYSNVSGNTNVSGMPTTNPQAGNVSVGTTSTSTQLASAPTRTGYTFKGWCLGTSGSSNITTNNGVDTCNSTTYDAAQDFGIDATGKNAGGTYNDVYYLYAIWEGNQYTATYYYNNNSTVGSTTIATATETCRVTDTNTSCDVTIPTAVRNSVGTYNNTYAGLANATGTMSATIAKDTTSITLTSNVTYYATYRTDVTNYYYNSGAYTNRTIYRNQWFTNNSTLATTVLATTETGTSNYGTANGIGSTASTWAGLNVNNTATSPSYASVSAAATANTTYTTLYTYYAFTVTYEKGTYTSSIGATSGTCYVSTNYPSSGGSSCNVTLPSITPNSNYESTGWSTTKDATSGTTAGSSYSLNTNGVKLYGNSKSSKLWFQNATSANCGSTMYDNRGTDTYKNVAYTTKKIGSLCWMTRNLDLPGGTKLTSSDTNLTTGFTLPASSTSGFSSYNTDYVYNSGSTSCGNGSPCYSYYSFYTATAHWGTNSVSSGSSSVDICPKGWRLPTQSEYSTLVSSYSTGSSLVSNWSAVYSGYYYYSSFGSGGSYGYYWSSTANYANYGYYLFFVSSNADGASNNLKSNGFAIRCVAKS